VLRGRVIRASFLSFISYFIILLATFIFTASVIVSKGSFPVPKNGLANLMFILLIFAALALRGLLLRVKYSLYLSTAVLIVSILSFSLLKGFLFPFLFPVAIVSVISLVFILRDRNFFHFPTRMFDRPEVAISIVVIVFILLAGVIGSLILGNQFRPRISDPTIALYYTGEVVTTLGFGDIIPVTPVARLFTVGLAIVGIGSFFGAATIIVAPYLYERGKRLVNVLQKAGSKRLESYILFLDFSPLVVPLMDYLIGKDELVVVAVDDKSKESSLKERRIFIEVEEDIENVVYSFDLRKAKKIILASERDGKNILNALAINSRFQGEVRERVISILNNIGNEEKLKPLVGEIIVPSQLVLETAKKLIDGN